MTLLIMSLQTATSGPSQVEMTQDAIAEALALHGVGAVCILKCGMVVIVEDNALKPNPEGVARYDLGGFFNAYHHGGAYPQNDDFDIIYVLPPGTELHADYTATYEDGRQGDTGLTRQEEMTCLARALASAGCDPDAVTAKSPVHYTIDVHHEAPFYAIIALLRIFNPASVGDFINSTELAQQARNPGDRHTHKAVCSRITAELEKSLEAVFNSLHLFDGAKTITEENVDFVIDAVKEDMRQEATEAVKRIDAAYPQNYERVLGIYGRLPVRLKLWLFASFI